MEWVVLLVLGAACLGTLSSALRSQRRTSPHSSVHAFRRSMRVLARHAPGGGTPSGRCVLVLDDPARVAATENGAPREVGRGRSGHPERASGHPERTTGCPAAHGEPRAAPSPQPGPHRPRPAARGPVTPAARRRLAVLRGLIGAVAISVVVWVVLDGWGVVLLAVSLLALAAYCALLASVRQQPARRDRPGAARRRPTAGPRSGQRASRASRDRNQADADPVARGA